MNPRTQNKDSLEDSVSTSPDPSKRGQLIKMGSGRGWSGHEEARGNPVGSPHISGGPEGNVARWPNNLFWNMIQGMWER